MSYLANNFLNAGIAQRAIKNNPVPKKGAANKNIKAIFPPIIKAMINEKINIKGPRIAVRIIIM